MDQYDRFLSKENFMLAFLRIKTMRRNEYKEFYYKDISAFEAFLDANINQLINDIKENKYQPRPACKYYVPKNKNLARPFSLLGFIDLIVYQAICNIIVDCTYDYRESSFDVSVFGNIPIKTDSENAIFAYTKWKDQWNAFKKAMRAQFNKGYQYVVEFDIASFYDTIDHKILESILKKRMIDNRLISLLGKCLNKWVISATDKYEFDKSCGIPQGPECSAVLSELLLFEIDEIFKSSFDGKTRYMRYADDIRVMAKNKIDCEKAIVYLDLICRDFSLIPQVFKIGIVELKKETIEKYINSTNLKFSTIATDFKRRGSLSEKNHNKLKRSLVECFNENDKDNYLNKTIIKFSLYKLNKDNEIKDLLLKNIGLLKPFLESVLYYLDLHYFADEEVRQLIHNLLEKDIALYQHDKAVVFGKCHNIPFDEMIYSSNMSNESERFWIIRYQVIQWLLRNGEEQMVLTISNDMNNYFIERELFIAKCRFITEEKAKKQLIINMLKHDNPMLALNALAQVGCYAINNYNSPQAERYNNFIKNILHMPVSNYIMEMLRSEFNIQEKMSKCFVDNIKKNEDFYQECCDDIMKYTQTKDVIPETALENLDLFNSIVTEMILIDEKHNKPAGDYGAFVLQLQSFLPQSAHAFSKIHENRNQRTAAHAKDKCQKIRKRITKIELKDLIKTVDLSGAYMEICKYYLERHNDSTP